MSLQTVLLLADRFHQSFVIGLSDLRFDVTDSDLSPETCKGFTLALLLKASRSWVFCRLSLIESRRLLAAPYRLGLRQLVRHRMPPIRFLLIGSRLPSTLPSEARRDDALALRYHFSSIWM